MRTSYISKSISATVTPANEHILPDRFTALARQMCARRPGPRLHPWISRKWWQPFLTTKTADQRMNSQLQWFSSLVCSQAYRKTFLSILKNKLPSWHTQNHSSQRFSCQYQQKDEGKELGHELGRESMYHDLPIQEHKLSQGYCINEVVPINGFIFLPIMRKRFAYHYIKKRKGL